VLLAAALFGTTGTASALGPAGTTPLGVGGARLLVGGAGLVVVLPLLGSRPRDAVALWRTPGGLVAGVCTALYQVCFFAGVARTGVAIGTLAAIGSGPVLAGALARLVLGERPGRAWATATVLCGIGLAALAGRGAGSGADPVGVLLSVTAGLGYAAYTVLARLLIVRGAAPAAVMAAAFSLGGVLLVPVLAVQPLGWLTTPGGALLAGYLGLVATTAAYVLFGQGLAVLPAGPVTTLVLAEPVVATALGTTVLGERLTATGAAGAVLVLAGLVVQGVGTARGSAGSRRVSGRGLRRPLP
jgi:DME family drug/metabolite transporter